MSSFMDADSKKFSVQKGSPIKTLPVFYTEPTTILASITLDTLDIELLALSRDKTL